VRAKASSNFLLPVGGEEEGRFQMLRREGDVAVISMIRYPYVVTFPDFCMVRVLEYQPIFCFFLPVSVEGGREVTDVEERGRCGSDQCDQLPLCVRFFRFLYNQIF
jgi:hypothetical protein